MSKWGGSEELLSEVDESAARGKLMEAGRFPCLNALYPGKFRAHCSKCASDVSVGLFTRIKGIFIPVYDDDAGKEIMYQIPLDVAENMVKKMATHKLRFGDSIYYADGCMHKGSKNLGADELAVSELDDSRAGLATAFVSGNTPMLQPEHNVYLLQGHRMCPFLMHYHEKATPSKRDIEACSHGYSLACIEGMDAEYDAMLDSKTGRF